jgi:hypothetical protein
MKNMIHGRRDYLLMKFCSFAYRITGAKVLYSNGTHPFYKCYLRDFVYFVGLDVLLSQI